MLFPSFMSIHFKSEINLCSIVLAIYELLTALACLFSCEPRPLTAMTQCFSQRRSMPSSIHVRLFYGVKSPFSSSLPASHPPSPITPQQPFKNVSHIQIPLSRCQFLKNRSLLFTHFSHMFPASHLIIKSRKELIHVDI